MKPYFFFIFSLFVLGLITAMSFNRTVVLPPNLDFKLGSNPADLTGHWQLFVDDYLVERKVNVKRIYHPFTKHPNNPLLVADKPWEGRTSYLYGTVLPNETNDGYKMWYHAWLGEYTNLYAISPDGLNWDKPELGLVEFQGSTDNNLFLRRTREDHIPQVIYTPWERDSSRRYKLINYDYGKTEPNNLVSGFYGAYSADGIHWNDTPVNPILKDPGDVGNFVWDPHENQYIGYPKVFAPVRGFRRRCVGYSSTTNFETWPQAELILVPDRADDFWVEEEYQRTEFYGLSGFAYESGYIGFLWIFPLTDGKNDGPIYCEIVSSRDGINWTRQEVQGGRRVPILPTGGPDDWDRGMVFSTNHPLIEDGHIKLWYGGSSATHSGRTDSSRSSIGLATLRKDGFASLQAGQDGGEVITKNFVGAQGQLLINANAEGGSIRVELLDGSGTVIPGYEKERCQVVNKDGLDLEVRWDDQDGLPDDKEIRFAFHLKNAALYSFMAGSELQLIDQPDSDRIFLDFEEEFESNALLKSYQLHGNAALVKDSSSNHISNSMVKLTPDVKTEVGRIEILNTNNLGTSFTMAARVKNLGGGHARIFSNHRGVGEFVTGEVVLDVDPHGVAFPGIRFVVNGQAVFSGKVNIHDEEWHHLAVTYDEGEVILYLDGDVVGSGFIKSGSVPLQADNGHRWYLENPTAPSKVGIQLGNNVFLGADRNKPFFARRRTILPSASKAALNGCIDDVIIAREALLPDQFMN